jgi:nucleoid-associated protein YgaU
MSTDVKLAILAGVGLISVFALVSYKKDMSARRLLGEGETAASTSFPGANRGLSRAGQFLPTPTITDKAGKRSPQGRQDGYHYRLHAGDTLTGLAQRFYGDGDRFVDILNANRALISTPNQLPQGTEIVIPGVDQRGRLLADSGTR